MNSCYKEGNERTMGLRNHEAEVGAKVRLVKDFKLRSAGRQGKIIRRYHVFDIECIDVSWSDVKGSFTTFELSRGDGQYLEIVSPAVGW